MTELLEPRAIGQSLVRRDGELKVRGAATYAYETPVENPAYCSLVQATVGRGRVSAVDTSAAEALPGVLAVLTHVSATLEELTYTDELADGNAIALRFKAKVGDRELEGIDFLELDEDGRVAELTVFMRPFSALTAFNEQMMARLGAAKG